MCNLWQVTVPKRKCKQFRNIWKIINNNQLNRFNVFNSLMEFLTALVCKHFVKS